MARRPANLWDQLIQEYRKTPIDLPGLKAVTLAQWMLESGRGSSELAREHNNFAGLKYRERMVGHAAPVDCTAHDGTATYCKFNSIAAFIKGYWHFISSGPYDGYADFKDDPVGYIGHLQAKGYAEDRNYSAKVIRLLAEAQQALGEIAEDEEPPRPSRRVFGDFAPPLFEPLPQIRHGVRGDRPNGLEGLIVHFDAFRIRRAGNGPENSDQRTIQMMQSGMDNGFHYGEISRTGRIFLPANFKWEEWGHHAGTSKCPLTNRTSVSQFYVGFEMNNPGLLHEAQEDGVFCPWFNSKRRADGSVILDSRGRCTRSSASDEWYKRDEVRLAQGGNIHKGWYLPYSHSQFESLVNIVGFLLNKFPTTFSIDKVFGHDEVSPGRKNDPGGALAHPDQVMTMAEFRSFLKTKF